MFLFGGLFHERKRRNWVLPVLILDVVIKLQPGWFGLYSELSDSRKAAVSSARLGGGRRSPHSLAMAVFSFLFQKRLAADHRCW